MRGCDENGARETAVHRAGAKGVLLIAALALGACGSAEPPQAAASETASATCRPLEANIAASVRTRLPQGTQLQQAFVAEVPGRTRSFDGGPYSVIAGHVVDAAGVRLNTAPVLVLWGGGTTLQHDTRPKDFYTLNDESIALVERAFAEMDEQTRARRIAIRDARTFREPFLETDPTVQLVLECLERGG
jgi:hypothetical protein